MSVTPATSRTTRKRVPGPFHDPHGSRSGARSMSWVSRFNRPLDPWSGNSDGQEEAAKAAILEKAMKGRQQTDLMLRCARFLSHPSAVHV